MDTCFKIRCSHAQKSWFSVLNGSYISEAGSILATLKKNIASVVSGIWGTIYNENKNKEKQLAGHCNALRSLIWKHELEKEV